jgi:hypothetical protein
MLNRSLLSFAYLAVAVSMCGACASAEVAAPDAGVVSSVPTSIAGTYAITGTLDLATLPEPATELLGVLAAATDAPDDPAAFLVDRMVAALPEGRWKAIASGLAPFVAPYIEQAIDRIAPRFAPGVHALATGLGALAHHVTTIERLTIANDGITTRALIGVQLANTPVDFAAGGAADQLAITRTAIDGAGTLAIATHRLAVPYGELLRLGLDRAVIPSLDLGASNLADALRDLVDCRQLGIEFAEHAGFGSPVLYETACAAGLTTIASEVYERLAAIDVAPFELYVSGTATGVDINHDGRMDVIRDGVWAGSTTYAGTKGALGQATFTGTKQ